MVRLGDLIKPVKVIRCGTNQYPVLSMTMYDGIMLQSDRFKKSLASVDQSDYKVVNYGQLAVGFPIDEGVLYIQRVVPSGIMSPAYSVWDVNYDIVDPLYLELSLHSPQAMQYYKENLRGTTARRRSIPTDTLLALPLRLPPLEEQRKIAAVLDKVSDLIAKRHRQLDKLDEMVKARFMEIFGDPETNTKNWHVLPMSKICSVGSSKRIYQSEQSSSGVPFWRISDLTSLITTGTVTPELYIPEERYKELKTQGQVPAPGDILITSRGTLGQCYIVKVNDRFYFQDGMISWLSGYMDGVTPLYISYLFTMPGFRKQIDSMQAGSTVAYLSITMIKKLKVMLPDIESQQQFASFVSKTEKTKTIISCSLEKLKTLKKALMQEYFG